MQNLDLSLVIDCLTESSLEDWVLALKLTREPNKSWYLLCEASVGFYLIWSQVASLWGTCCRVLLPLSNFRNQQGVQDWQRKLSLLRCNHVFPRHSTGQHSTVQYRTVQHSTAKYNSTSHNDWLGLGMVPPQVLGVSLSTDFNSMSEGRYD